MALSATTPELTAVARSQVYQFLAKSFSFPDEAIWCELKSRPLILKMDSAIASLPDCALELSERWDAVQRQSHLFQTRPELERTYFELFEATRNSAACPLYESFYRTEDRSDTMAELVRFYNFFGLTMGRSAREMPDHLKVELEFLHYLTFLETSDSVTHNTLGSLWRAQLDFHRRHLQLWTPQLWERIERQKSPYFSAVAALSRMYFKCEMEHLTRRKL